MKRIGENKLDIEEVKYFHINRMLAHVISSTTASIRFDGALNVDLSEFQTNLVPYPRISFITSAYSPWISCNKYIYNWRSVTDISL